MGDCWILLYHGVEEPGDAAPCASAAEQRLVVSAAQFRQQLSVLGELGLELLDLEASLANPFADNRRAVVITFDDGYRNNYTHAFPALLEAKARACFYVVAGKIDRDRKYMDRTQLQELAEAGMTIGSHTMTHAFLSRLKDPEILRELADSRARLEDLLGRPVEHLAIPGGHFNRRVLRIARQCGYRSVATCRVGVFRPGGDVFRLPRLEIRNGLSLRGFCRTFDHDKLIQLQLLDLGKACLRRTLGLRLYGKVRQLAHRLIPLTR